MEVEDRLQYILEAPDGFLISPPTPQPLDRRDSLGTDKVKVNLPPFSVFSLQTGTHEPPSPSPSPFLQILVTSISMGTITSKFRRNPLPLPPPPVTPAKRSRSPSPSLEAPEEESSAPSTSTLTSTDPAARPVRTPPRKKPKLNVTATDVGDSENVEDDGDDGYGEMVGVEEGKGDRMEGVEVVEKYDRFKVSVLSWCGVAAK